MIQKEKEHLEKSSDRRIAAGEKAERQMAHYLKRAFGDEEWVWVFHDLRFQLDDKDAIQIDHLVLHRYGMILIESKSVSTEVRINEHEEWERKYGKWQGMPSPIKQVERQAAGLRTLLRPQDRELLGTMLFGALQKGFRNFPMAKLVAISDSGRITGRGRKLVEAHVRKADQICEAAKEIIKQRKKEEGFFNTGPVPDEVGSLTEEEMVKVSNFLLQHHAPRSNPGRKTETPPPLPAAHPLPITDPDTKEVQEVVVEESCPRCEAQLILRTATKGAKAGNQFWGCSRFPKCRYTKDAK